MTNLQSYAAPLGRLMLAFIFILAGAQKITGYAGTQGYMEMMGVPGALLPLVILLEFGGALFMALGLLTRLTAVALAAFTLAADLIFVTTIGTNVGRYLFGAEFTILAAFFALMAAGAGRWSLDAIRTRNRPRSLPTA